MKNNAKKKNLYKKVLIACIFIYAACVFINQQKTLNSYKRTEKYYEEQILAKKEYQEELYEAKQNINSEEYIEEVAREKLDMYLPNERVYIDKGK